MARVLIVNGPNLNLLGEREPEQYGRDTLATIESNIRMDGLRADWRQSNHEGELIDWVHEARRQADAIVINPGGLSHTSVSLRDALAAFEGPKVEVHISNVFARESFRHTLITATACDACISGFGAGGYQIAIDEVLRRLET